jgi:BASS family bile acid:Na+ symporter
MTSKFASFYQTYGKGLSLFVMMGLGFLFPQASHLSFMIQYLLMTMLFFSFLDLRFNKSMLSGGVFLILLANITVALTAYWIFSGSNLTLALVAFMTGIAPTAISSPVMISFVQGKVPYVVASLVLTNLSSAILVPLILPALVGGEMSISMLDVLGSSVTVMFVPLVLAQLVRMLPEQAQDVIRRGKCFNFPIWLVNLFIISAKAATFILFENTGSLTIVLEIALLSLVLCAVNFTLGAVIGGKEYWREGSQALGQKNLSFVIWIALTYINPLIALGPIFYILYHHIYNSWMISQFEKQRIQAVQELV